MRIAVRVLWVAGLAGLAAFVAAAGFGVGDPRSSPFEVLYTSLYLVPAALCLLRATLIAEERIAWALIGIGMAAFAAGYGHYFAILQYLEDPPYPSLSDALWLTYYGTSFGGLMLLMKARLRSFGGGFWIEAAVGALALAAVSAALLVQPILASTGGSLGAVATNMAYPLADVLIVGLVLGPAGG